MRNRLAAALLIILLLAGCSAPEPPAVDVSGTWSGTGTLMRTRETAPVTLELEQEGALVSGFLTLDGADGEQPAAPLTGTVAGRRLSLRFSLDTETLRGRGTLSGLINGDEYRSRGHVRVPGIGRQLAVRLLARRH